eukprot:2985706-Prymnesium_polylepis.1
MSMLLIIELIVRRVCLLGRASCRRSFSVVAFLSFSARALIHVVRRSLIGTRPPSGPRAEHGKEGLRIGVGARCGKRAWRFNERNS